MGVRCICKRNCAACFFGCTLYTLRPWSAFASAAMQRV